MNKAFTLVEILVVSTIIGFLALAGIVSYTQFMKISRDSRRKTDIEMVRAGIEMFRSKNNRYPYSAEIVFNGTADLCDPGGSCSTGTYIKKIPKDPKNEYNYYYNYISNTDYMIGAHLEQGSGSTSCGNNCGSGAACNYCLGPYGQL